MAAATPSKPPSRPSTTETGENVIMPGEDAVLPDWTAGVRVLMDILCKGMQLDPQVEKGNEMKKFFKNSESDWRANESIADYIVRFKESVSRLELREIPLHTEVQGWWFLEKANLSGENYARVLSWTDGDWSLPVIERCMMRVMPRTVTDRARAAPSA